ncbi:uncharacterized protein LOC143586971 [Bidens hawaiensis]|uniref:uncharacterized protein LOC143586971 n=1 Tax=Bidens hawaiensis TaxID=980011 RepID=UPI00404A6490
MDADTRYSMLEKLVLALVYASRRLQRYFQGRPINVLTGYKLKNVLGKQELSGRLRKWAIELGEHSIKYKPRPAERGQECLNNPQPPVPPEKDRVWSLFTDGTSSGEGSGAGLRLVNLEGQEFTYAIKLNFKSTNTEAENEVFLVGLQIARKLGICHLEARVDSMMIEEQITGAH